MFKNYILFALTVIGLCTACDDGPNDPVLQLGAAPTITAPAPNTAYVLDENTPNAVVEVVTWTAADFGYDAAVTYRAMIDAAGNDFADAVTLGATNTLTFDSYTMGQLNNVLLAKGLPFGFDNPLELRICADVGSGVEQLCSEAIPITVNPYQAEVVYPFLTVPGDYQDWNPGDENYKVFSRKSDEIYEGYIYFDLEIANYKFAQGLSWDVNWGDIEPDGILDAGGVDNNIMTDGGVGLYRLTVNLNELTHTQLKTDWGVLGDATAGGWDTDTDLIWDTDREVLTVTLDLTVGELKFRANDSDDVNFGDDFTNGTLEADGLNIPITEAGNYTIDLMLNQSDYAYTLTKN